jgi:hypothetical protein
MSPLVEFRKINGNLVITLTPAGREEIATAEADGENIDSDFYMGQLFDHPFCNGWEVIQPEEIAALTSAPIFSDEAERDEQGKLLAVRRVYWFPNYQIESPIQTLKEKGVVIFTGVGDEVDDRPSRANVSKN